MHSDILAKVLNFRNDPGNPVEVKNMFTLRPAPSTEFQGGSCCDSQVCQGPHICRVLPGCVIAHSKTPTHVHGTLNYVSLDYARLQYFFMNYAKYYTILYYGDDWKDYKDSGTESAGIGDD